MPSEMEQKVLKETGMDKYHHNRKMTIEEYLSLKDMSEFIKILKDLSDKKITHDKAREQAHGTYKVLNRKTVEDMMDDNPKEWHAAVPIKTYDRKDVTLCPENELVDLIERDVQKQKEIEEYSFK